MSKKPTTPAAPEGISALLAQADQQRGFPAGTMASIMQQETGGNPKYLQDPTTYHYGLNEDGKRVAGHTGKVSTAFGPFGILESTASKLGYGVVPLQNKSLEEQVRFAADYLAARSKDGGLAAGLAGYGEGEKYAKQVLARVGTPPKAQAPAAQAGGADPVMAGGGVPAMAASREKVAPLYQVEDLAAVPAPTAADYAAMQNYRLSEDPRSVVAQGAPDSRAMWENLVQAMPQKYLQPRDMNYGRRTKAEQSVQPDFRGFDSMRAWG